MIQFAAWYRDQRVSAMDSPHIVDGRLVIEVETIAPWGEAYAATAPADEIIIRPFRPIEMERQA